jgi:DDE superfamily endonuclease
LILVYLKTYPLQVVQGRLFGMDQSQANQWIHTLLGVRQGALCTLGDAPSRSLPELAQRVGVTEAEAAALCVPTAELSTPAELSAVAPVLAPTAPLLATMAPNGASRAPRTRLNRRAVIVVRKHAIR